MRKPGERKYKTEEIKKKEKKTTVERMDCLICGAKNGMEFIRSPYNGHIHGKCDACGAKLIE